MRRSCSKILELDRSLSARGKTFIETFTSLYLAKVSTVTRAGEASNGTSRLADTLGESDLVDALRRLEGRDVGLLGGNDNTTARGGSGDINGLRKEHQQVYYQ